MVIAVAYVSLPASTVLNPERLLMPRIECTPGRRISQSTSRTLPPFCASTIAVFTLVVVLPSWGRALVMRMIFGGEPREERRMEVRSARYDSAIPDFGRAWAINPTLDFVADLPTSIFCCVPLVSKGRLR